MNCAVLTSICAILHVQWNNINNETYASKQTQSSMQCKTSHDLWALKMAGKWRIYLLPIRTFFKFFLSFRDTNCIYLLSTLNKMCIYKRVTHWSTIHHCSRHFDYLTSRLEQTFIFIFRENKTWHFIRIVCLADESHKSYVLFSLKNI